MTNTINKEKMNNLFHEMSKQRVEDELLSKTNLEIINEDIPEFKKYLNELDVYYGYKQGISTKLNYHICDFHNVFGFEKNYNELLEAKEKLINYKAKIEAILDRHLSWSEYGYLINAIRKD